MQARINGHARARSNQGRVRPVTRKERPRLDFAQMRRVDVGELTSLIRTTVGSWQEDRGSRLGAALAYYTALSVAPSLPTYMLPVTVRSALRISMIRQPRWKTPFDYDQTSRVTQVKRSDRRDYGRGDCIPIFGARASDSSGLRHHFDLHTGAPSGGTCSAFPPCPPSPLPAREP